MFDPTVIPAANNTPKQRSAHIELYKRSQDTCRIHNPTDEDFIVYNDRKISNERWVVPNKDKSTGAGKGNLDAPRYIALRYLNKMGEKLIIKKSEEEWAKKKLQYRQDEWGEKEERMALKVNNKQEWARITPTLFLGVIARYQDEIYADGPGEDERKKQTFSKAEEALEALGMADMEVGVSDDLEEKKNNLAEQLI